MHDTIPDYDVPVFDVIVAGGGLSGMIATYAFAQAGLTVLCVDPAEPVVTREAADADHRSTALLQPSRQLLIRIGLWDRLVPFASALAMMRIVDAGGVENAPRLIRDFDASDIGPLPFGWNLPNWLLRRELSAALAEHPRVTHRGTLAATRVLARSREARVSLSDGSTTRARLVIAADGRNSTLRTGAKIGVKTTRYAQKALAFAVRHPLPHNNVSTEIHRSGGPFTLVPLPDDAHGPCSAVVWMEHGPQAVRLMALPEAAFNDAITERSCDLLGRLSLNSRRTLWPIISQIADRFYGERLALIAEAAHVVPPIGAQGLNMSLADIACLLDLAEADPGALGSPEMLARYHRARRPDVALRHAGIDALNRASMIDAQALRDLRMRTLGLLYGLPPLRRRLMKTGLGAVR